MDYLKLLSDNTSKILSHSKKIRDMLNDILDKDSFVETDMFLSGASMLDGSQAYGEGVITGYATINDYPVCIAAQNSEVLGGSLSKAQADKILKVIKRSMETDIPLISIIDSAGARLGEGISALEGYAQIISSAAELSKYTPHIAIIKGNAIGLMGMYAACADFIFMSDDSVLSAQSPLTLAENVNDIPQKLLGGSTYRESSLLTIIDYKNNGELKNKISQIFAYTCDKISENEDDPNRTSDALNIDVKSDNLIAALADEGSLIEMYADYTQYTKTYLATVNSLAAGIVATNAEKLTKAAINKITAFVKLLDKYDLPLITLVNTKGLEGELSEEKQGLIYDAAKLIATISQTDIPKIAVIADYAIGYGYVALASKSVGFDYALAFANAKIAPVTSEAAASIIYSKELKAEGEPSEIRQKLIEKYAQEEMNPFVSAKGGYVDNIIEPALLRPYVASALMMLLN